MVGPDLAVYIHKHLTAIRLTLAFSRYDEKFKQESAQKLAEVRD